jgi:flagellar biosynthesis GTPase FlhF
MNQQQPQLNQQQPQMNQQQPQLNQQQPQMNQQQPQLNQQQPQLNQQQPQMNQQQPQLNQQQFQMNQQQPQLNQQQQYYQGNMQGPSIQNPQFMQPIQPPPFGNQFQQPTYDHSAAQIPSSPFGPNERYLVGNLSEPFSFLVAPPSIKVTYLGLNGYSLYILGMGFSNKSKFNYDEQNNRLTILSLDPTTVGYYSAVDANWQNFVNVLSAINGNLLIEKRTDVNNSFLFSFFSTNS